MMLIEKFKHKTDCELKLFQFYSQKRLQVLRTKRWLLSGKTTSQGPMLTPWVTIFKVFNYKHNLKAIMSY